MSDECPFRCGWAVRDAIDAEDARLAICAHLIGEHGAYRDRDPEFLLDASGFREPIERFEFPSKRRKQDGER